MKTRNIFHLKIRTKIFLTLLGLSLLALFAFGLIAFKDMEELGRYALDRSTTLGENAVTDTIEALKQQTEEFLLQVVKDQAALSDALLSKVQDEVAVLVDYAENLWGRGVVENYRYSFSQEEKPDDIYEHSVYALAPDVKMNIVENELNISSNIDDLFIPIFDNDQNINTICLGTETGIFRSYPWRTGRSPKYDPRQRSWYRKAVKAGKCVWTDPYIHAATRELIVTCAEPFYNTNKELLGVIEADVTLDVLNNKIMSTQIGQHDYAFLIDAKGKIIAKPGLKVGDTGWDQVYRTENLLHNKNSEFKKIIEDMISGGTGVAVCDFAGGEKYIAYAPVSTTKWFLGIVMPLSDIIAPALVTKGKIESVTLATRDYIDEQIRQVVHVLSIVFLVIVAFVFLVAFRLSKRMTKPILTLNKGTRIIGGGNLDYKFDIKTGDEIEELAGAFNKMAQDLKEYIDNLKKATAERERIQSELKIAHDIQMNIIPKTFPPFPDKKEFDIYALLKPAREVGGDFYDFFLIDDSHLGFIIGDVTGKGVPAALFMAVAKSLIKATACEVKDPKKILNIVNSEMVAESNAGMFVTTFLGILDIKTGAVKYFNCGHNQPLLIRKNGENEFLKRAGSTPLGILENIVFVQEDVIMEPGDTIFMYTDGVSEAFNKDREQFTVDRLKEKAEVYQQGSLRELVVNVLREIQLFAQGVSQSDDITMMTLRYFGQGAS